MSEGVGGSVGADLAAIEARLTAAAAGPWTAVGREIVIATANRVDCVAFVREHNLEGPLGVRSQVTAEFIAHAPSDVASLLALVRQLQGQLDAARAWLKSADPYPERNGDHFAELRAILAAQEAM